MYPGLRDRLSVALGFDHMVNLAGGIRARRIINNDAIAHSRFHYASLVGQLTVSPLPILLGLKRKSFSENRLSVSRHLELEDAVGTQSFLRRASTSPADFSEVYFNHELNPWVDRKAHGSRSGNKRAQSARECILIPRGIFVLCLGIGRTGQISILDETPHQGR
jgi:hypothetical protein